MHATTNHVFIIAEAGVNHNGDMDIARKLIDAAATAGADAVKFQTFKADKIVTKYAVKSEYQKQTTNVQESQYDMLKKLELDTDIHKELMEYCEKQGIQFLSTPYDNESIDLLTGLGLPLLKIPSNEIINKPLLQYFGKSGTEENILKLIDDIVEGNENGHKK